MKIHILKTWPVEFEATRIGSKTAEYRKDDGRGFEVGDGLILREWDPGSKKYTGREVSVVVTYVVRGPSFGIEHQHVMMSIRQDVAVLEDLRARFRVLLDRVGGESFALVKDACQDDFERAFVRAARDAIQDDCENAPFGSVGGLGKRSDLEVPRYIVDQECCGLAYVAGYQEAARLMYGEDWRTCEFRWELALAIGGFGEGARVIEIAGQPVEGAGS